MAASWMEFVSGCKTRWSALARSLFLGRRLWQQKYFETKQALKESQALLAQSEARCRQLEQQPQALVQQVAALQSQLTEPQPVSLPLGAPPPRVKQRCQEPLLSQGGCRGETKVSGTIIVSGRLQNRQLLE